MVGTVETIPWSFPVLVLAESWPSWSFAAQALGCVDITTWCRFVSAKSKVEFESTRLGSTLMSCSLKEVARKLTGQPGLTILIQGGASFANEHRRWAEKEFKKAKTLEFIPEGKEDGWDNTFLWKGNVSHQSLGGVTSGTWSYRCSEPLPEPRKGFARNLGLILNPVHGGRVESKVPLDLLRARKPLTSCNLVAPGVRSPWVKAPSVFTHDEEPVIRRLHVDELLDVYDVEVSIQKELGKCWRLGQWSPSYAFASSAPMKVLMAIGRSFYGKLQADGWPIGMFTVNENDRARKRPANENTASSATGTASQLHQPEVMSDHAKRPRNCRFDAPRDVEFIDSSDDRGGSIGVSLDPSVKAAKDDDAEVIEQQWDVWSVDNFNPPGNEVGKVCVPGSYCGVKHGRFFSSLRSMALRWYRRRILQSFLKYLRSHHGGGKVYEEVVLWNGVPRTAKIPLWVKLRYKFRSMAGSHRKRGKPDQPEFRKDLLVGREAVWRSTLATWWNWDGGSTLYFWRWPTCVRPSIRDGTKAFIHRDRLPSYTQPQKLSKDPDTRDRVRRKVNGVRGRCYIREGGVKSTTGFFDVPKGESDIRMVYDATKCGLNAALWTPNFFLPTIDSILRNADERTWFGDIDLGEMFLNYWLDEELRPYAGVDVTLLGERSIRPDGTIEFQETNSKKTLWERWERTLMGFQSSPYICTQAFGWCEDFIRGNPDDHEGNPLAWERVVLNLPGLQGYQPTKPWVFRTKFDGTMAAFFGTYIDDIRTGDGSETGCRSTTRRVASRVNYLGQQDAPRKRRPPSKKPGAWSGAMCESIEGKGLFVTCSQEKWNKAKGIVDGRFREVVVEEASSLDYKSLEKDVGFLVHMSRTFPSIFPYLRGIYNTLNGWRRGRDRDGWKLTRREWDLFLAMEEEMEDEELDTEERTRSGKMPAKTNGKTSRSSVPGRVNPVPRLSRDLTALQRLFSEEHPPLRLVRGHLLNAVKYAFGDASKAGFGASWVSDKGVKYRFGTWGRDMDNSSSNLRELKNLVDTLKKMAVDGELEGSETFIFTDNSTAEAAFFKGSSKSKLLFELILELRELEMKNKAKIHFVHVAGTRMIAQGSDGLSRGNVSEGVMRGEAMSSFIPLNEGAFERSPSLKEWLRSWTGEELEFLEPRDWFVRGQDIVEGEYERNIDGFMWPKYRKGTFVWAPPPAAAEPALEELRKARHRRTSSTHLVLIPRLLTPYWRKHLNKVSDIVLTLPVGHPVWPLNMHEPLTIGIVFPLIRYRPWRLHRSPILLDLEKHLRSLWKTDPGSEGPLLRKLWGLPRKLAGLSQKLVWQLLRSSHKPEVPDCPPRKRRRVKMEEEKG